MMIRDVLHALKFDVAGTHALNANDVSYVYRLSPNVRNSFFFSAEGE